jgi:UDP-N-acetylglucosamine diphosphorylase/glucosamine-1-phosphate N-acetyltransferase
MNIIVSDFGFHKKLLPLSFTKAIADFRIGILTIKEKWEKLSNSKVSVLTEDYLQKKYPLIIEKQNTVVNATVIPNVNLLDIISNLKNQTLVKDNLVIAYNSESTDFCDIPPDRVEYLGEIIFIDSLSDIFRLNGVCLMADFELITKNRKSQSLSKTNTVIGNNPIFVEEGCFVECSTFNTTEGPIYIGHNATIMEGSNIRGPFAICDHSELKMGAKIYGPTTIGPWCKVGGEVNNVVFFAYSNKGHDGFLGNSVIGEWCNIGADSNNSNLKNNYADVKLWSYISEKFENTGLQFCGLIMGDHSKCGINTMFNTGTVVGVSANIFGAGFPRNFIPSFSWGGHSGLMEYKIENAFDVMVKVMKRRNIELTETDKDILNHIFNETAKYRKF